MSRQTDGNQQVYPKLTGVRVPTEVTQALTSLLTHEPGAVRTTSAANPQIGLNRFQLEQISNNTAQNVIDSDAITQLLPDIELVEQIMVGSILSPKDMAGADTSYVTAEGQFDSELAAPMLEIIENHFKHDYKIDERMDIMLEEILMTKGAHVLAVLPENNLDMIINNNRRLSMENFDSMMRRMQTNQPLGFLGHPHEARVSLEDFNGDLERVQHVRQSIKGREVVLPHVTVTDNFNTLKTPDFKKRRREMAISQRLGKLRVSIESATNNLAEGLNSAQIDELYRRPHPGSKHAQVLVSQSFMDRPPVGHPLVLTLPIESVIPVFTPGKPDEHVGYFVLLDNFGRPVVKSSGRDYYGELRTNFNGANGKDNSSSLLRMTREAMGNANTEGSLELEQVHQTYSAILENDLQNRLRHGLYDEELDIGFTEEIQRIMLYRSFKAQNTQLLYVPAELITYIAFNYNKDGVGQTLLARSKILANMRSILLFADTMGGVRNAVGRKKVNINIDPHDTDPAKTISDIQSMILESSQRGFPLGAPDPSQSLDYLNRAGFDFAVNVDNESYAQTKVEYDDYTTNVQAGNPELQDRLRRMHISGMGLPPDIADPQATPDFAVSVVNNNLILTRRVKRYQRLLTGALSKFVRCYTAHSSTLLARLREIVEQNGGKRSPEQKNMQVDDIVLDFIEAIEMRLPEPDTTKIDQNLQAYEQFNTLLDRALEAYVNEDLYPEEAIGGIPNATRIAIAHIRAYYQRQFLARNNIMPELEVLNRMDGDKPMFSLLDIQKAGMESLGTALQEFAKDVAGIKEKFDEKYQPTESADDAPFGDEPAEPADTDAEAPATDDDFNFDMDDPKSDDETPAESEAEEVETPEVPDEEESTETAEETPKEDEAEEAEPADEEEPDEEDKDK
jgi:hypothetical protein